MLNLGARAHDFGKFSLEELADKIALHGFTCVQLALAKSIPGIGTAPGNLSPGLGNYVRDVFATRGISIAVLGCYINPIHPDPAEKEKGILRFEEHLRYARDFGCSIVGTETGSRNPDSSYNPLTEKEDAFLEFVEVFKRLVKTAEKAGTIVGVEGVADKNTIHSFDRMVRLLEMIDSPNLQVIYDPVNFISIASWQDHEKQMAEAFERFGARIAVIHAKDFVIRDGKKIGDIPSGTGILNYPLLLKLIAEKKPGVHVLLENTEPATVADTARFIRSTYASL